MFSPGTTKNAFSVSCVRHGHIPLTPQPSSPTPSATSSQGTSGQTPSPDTTVIATPLISTIPPSEDDQSYVTSGDTRTELPGTGHMGALAYTIENRIKAGYVYNFVTNMNHSTAKTKAIGIISVKKNHSSL